MAEKIKITFLGTSAQIPTKKRNHPAILLNYKGEHLLFDCGEGTQRQFRKARINLGKINKILITHIHGDHVFGLPGLLSTLNNSEYNKELIIYGPKGIKKFMKGILSIFEFTKNYPLKVQEVSGKFFETDDFYIEAEKMEHGIPCNAYSFVVKDKLRIDKKKLFKTKIPSGPLISQLKRGKDIVYKNKKYKSKDLTYLEKGKKISIVMDTRMNNRIVPFVKNSDLLICESSFGEDMKEFAKERFHLTAKQVGEIAKKSKSKKLILVHISQRYEKNLSELLEDVKKNFKEVSIAKDLEEVEI